MASTSRPPRPVITSAPMPAPPEESSHRPGFSFRHTGCAGRYPHCAGFPPGPGSAAEVVAGMLAAAKAGTQETADTPDASDDMDTDRLSGLVDGADPGDRAGILAGGIRGVDHAVDSAWRPDRGPEQPPQHDQLLR